MSRLAEPPSPATIAGPIPLPRKWSRPLLAMAAFMALASPVLIVLAIVNPFEVQGTNAWFKPLKFTLSTTIYSVSLAWLLGQLTRYPRFASFAGWATLALLFPEVVIIIIAAAYGTTSHFNFTTPISAAAFSFMGISIALVWAIALVVGILVARSPQPDPARRFMVRAAILIALIGMAAGGLMVIPTESQIDNYEGIIGAHAVGVPDGGPGLPFLGWSTVAGDLRIPHFVGMHALQALPLLLLAMEVAARWVGILKSAQVRRNLSVVAACAYATMMGLLAWQAFLGQSIVRPGGVILVAGMALAALVVIAVVVVLVRAPGDQEVDSARSSEPSTTT